MKIAQVLMFVVVAVNFPLQLIAESQVILERQKVIELFDAYSLKKDSAIGDAILSLIPDGSKSIFDCYEEIKCGDYSRSFFNLTSVLSKEVESGNSEAIDIASRLVWISDGEYTLEVLDLISRLLPEYPDKFLVVVKDNKIFNQSLDRILESGFDSLSQVKMCSNFSRNIHAISEIKDFELSEVRIMALKILNELSSEYSCNNDT